MVTCFLVVICFLTMCSTTFVMWVLFSFVVVIREERELLEDLEYIGYTRWVSLEIILSFFKFIVILKYHLVILFLVKLILVLVTGL